MVFKIYGRYAWILICAVFLPFVYWVTKDKTVVTLFSVFCIFSMFYSFCKYYIIQDDKICEYFMGLKTNEINIKDIKKVVIVTVKQYGQHYFYIGKAANATKENGYYFILKDGTKHKIYSSFRSDYTLTLGIYITSNYRVGTESITKYKLFNDHFD